MGDRDEIEHRLKQDINVEGLPEQQLQNMQVAINLGMTNFLTLKLRANLEVLVHG